MDLSGFTVCSIICRALVVTFERHSGTKTSVFQFAFTIIVWSAVFSVKVFPVAVGGMFKFLTTLTSFCEFAANVGCKSCFETPAD